MRDPKQLFTTNVIARCQIAEDLNDFLDCNESETTDRLTPDDDRLTDEICSEYAAEMGQLDQFDEDEFEDEKAFDPFEFQTAAEVHDEKLAEITLRYLNKLGITP